MYAHMLAVHMLTLGKPRPSHSNSTMSKHAQKGWLSICTSWFALLSASSHLLQELLHQASIVQPSFTASVVLACSALREHLQNTCAESLQLTSFALPVKKCVWQRIAAELKHMHKICKQSCCTGAVLTDHTCKGGSHNKTV